MRSSEIVFTVTAERPAYGGHAIARSGGKVLFVRGAIPGETVEVRIDEEKRDYALATAVRILAPSPDRVTPPCPVFGICGGCQLQYVAYPRQVSLKEESLLDALRRTGRIDTSLGPSLCIGEPRHYHYRYRGQFKVGNAALGLYREKSHQVVGIESCPLMTKEVNAWFRKVHGRFVKRPEAFSCIAELHITAESEAVALVRAVQDAGKTDIKGLADQLQGLGFSEVCVERPGYPTRCRTGALLGLDLSGLKYDASPLSFIQSHWRLNTLVVKTIRERLKPLAGKRVLDLYSGAGNISLPLALDAAEVIAVEENQAALRDGIENAKRNDIGNCRFIGSPVERLAVKEKVDIVVIDPPRLGISNAAMDKILALSPSRIVSLSCNPATFARDLKKLLGMYEIESIQLVDFFPQTYHIETLAFLKKR